MQDRREKGLYWDRAWKLVEGCTHVSPGCDNCWSETETVMRANHPNDAIRTRAQHVVMMKQPHTCFDGSILLREDSLDLPLRVKKPTVWACWNDLYHEDVPDEFRDRAYAVMALCPQHTFLVLTKRAQRMAEYLSTSRNFACPWGNNNKVWHGVTAENQQPADERIPHLLRVPGNLFVSVEPMLGPVDLRLFQYEDTGEADDNGKPYADTRRRRIGCVLLGGESGKNARPMHPQWARDVRDQCAAAGVPYFHKQNGEWIETDDVKLQSFGEIARVGKRRAGRLLDGRTHDELPFGQEVSK